MLLIWVLLGSVAGIGLMILLNHRLGLNTPAEIASMDDALRRLDIDQVGFEAGDARLLADDRRSALIEEKGSGRVGLLAARGDGVVIRYLEPGSVKSAKMGEGRDIMLRLDDFTFAPLTIQLEDTHTARRWADRLNALQA